MKVLLVPNYLRDDAREAAGELARWLESEGVDVSFAQDKALAIDESRLLEGVNLVISLGGDGTLLRAARLVGYTEVPILGISYGHLGFLTCSGPKDMFEVVSLALAGELHASRRATLSIEVDVDYPDGTCATHEAFALNDLALTRGYRGNMIEFDVEVSGTHIDRLRGDGFIVSTATGSTGYALASGGPIVTPEFNGLVCVPVAPHTILARAFLTSPSDVVELVLSAERPAERSAFADGEMICEGGLIRAVRVRRGRGDIILYDRGPNSFYSSVSRVFWGQVGK